MAINQTYVGTELKFAFTIAASGFDMEEDNFQIQLKGAKKSLLIPKEDCFTDDNDQWYFTFDSSKLGTGMVNAIFTAFVPDDDFEDGYRTEVTKIDLIYIKM